MIELALAVPLASQTSQVIAPQSQGRHLVQQRSAAEDFALTPRPIETLRVWIPDGVSAYVRLPEH